MTGPQTGFLPGTVGHRILNVRQANIQLHFIRSLSMSISQIMQKTSNFIFLFDNIDLCRYNEPKAYYIA